MGVEDRNYHMERARFELDWAYRAERDAAAQAHLRLSALHMQRLRDLDDSCGGADIGR
ncbi:MAG TPA: hypothetical protein VF552_03990 [Allosphingosinicella sp.]|jgi:hypothetical protein